MNEEVRLKNIWRKNLSEKSAKKIQRCLEINKTMYKSDVESRKDGGQPSINQLKGVKKVCFAGSLEVSDAKVKYINREQSRDFVMDVKGK